MIFVRVLLVIVVLLGLNGCWDRRELNEISFVTGMAIEKGEDQQYYLSVEAINAAELNAQTAEGKTPTITYTMEGNTIAELTDKMHVSITRDLEFSHTRAIIMDEELAREGIAPFLQFLERNSEIRNDIHLLIAKGVKARDIISTTYPVQKAPSLKLDVQIQSMIDEWGGYQDDHLTDFSTHIISKGRQPVSAVVSIEGNPEKGKTMENNNKTELDSLVVLNGLAIFNQDKLIGFLSVEETRNYVWTQNLSNTSISAPCSNDKFFTMRVNNSQTEVEVDYKNDKPFITVELVIEGDILTSQCKENEDKLKQIKEFEGIMKDQVEKQVKGVITHVQEEYSLDIFGFGEDMNRQHYQQFKKVEDQWDEEFAKAVIEVDAKVFIRREGIRSKTILDEMEEYNGEE